MADYDEWTESVQYQRSFQPRGVYEMQENPSANNRRSVVLYAADGNMNLPVRQASQQSLGAGSGRNNRKSAFFPHLDVPGGGSHFSEPGPSASQTNLGASAISIAAPEKKDPIYKKESAVIQLVISIVVLLGSLALLFFGSACLVATCDQFLTGGSCPKVSFFSKSFCGVGADPNGGIAMVVVGCLLFPATMWSFCTIGRPRFKFVGYRDNNSSTATLNR